MSADETAPDDSEPDTTFVFEPPLEGEVALLESTLEGAWPNPAILI